MGELIQQGYELIRSGQRTEACDRWLEAWELVKQIARPEWRTTREFDMANRGPWECVFNWCQDMEQRLGNAGWDDPVYYEHRLRYAREFLERFSDEDANHYVNFMRAQGEALWHLGRQAEADAVYASLVEQYPDEAWGYIGWADQYWLFRGRPKEYERAEAIMKRALARPDLNDRDDLLERLDDLRAEWGKPEEQAEMAAQRAEVASKPKVGSRPEFLASALGLPLGSPAPVTMPKPTPVVAPKPEPPRKSEPAPARKTEVVRTVKLGRNAPCWCGSGKKYKKCHLRADEEGKLR